MTPNAPSHAPLRLAQRGIVLVVCLSLGMQWVLLQGIAWTGMLISFASEGAMIEAVEKTFDGQHACALCLKVKEGRDSDENQPQQAGQSLKKLDAVLVAVVALIAPAAEEMNFAVLREQSVSRNERPEMPPPRRGLV
jgi:hypothetical protein